jgi:hypothetical protein
MKIEEGKGGVGSGCLSWRDESKTADDSKALGLIGKARALVGVDGKFSMSFGTIWCAAASSLLVGGKGPDSAADTGRKSGSGRLDFAFGRGEIGYTVIRGSVESLVRWQGTRCGAMWQCVKCCEKVQQNFDICWNCGATRDGTGNLTFRMGDDIPLGPDACPTDTESDAADLARTPLLKQAYDLTLDDFARYPVWVQCHLVDYDEPWYEETDEATFRSWAGTKPVDPQEATFLIRATMTLANGSKLNGFLTPQSAEQPLDLGTVQPMVFSEAGEQLAFWDGAYKRAEEDRVRFYAALGVGAKEIFPIFFSGEPGLAVGWVAGTIPGLCCLKDFKEVEVYT